MEEHYGQVQATYSLILEYGMEVPALEMAAYHTLTADMNSLQQAMDDLESHQEEHTEALSRELSTSLPNCNQSQAIKLFSASVGPVLTPSCVHDHHNTSICFIQ